MHNESLLTCTQSNAHDLAPGSKPGKQFIKVGGTGAEVSALASELCPGFKF